MGLVKFIHQSLDFGVVPVFLSGEFFESSPVGFAADDTRQVVFNQETDRAGVLVDEVLYGYVFRNVCHSTGSLNVKQLRL